MRLRLPLATALGGLAAATAFPFAISALPQAAASPPPPTPIPATTLHFAVLVGPNNDVPCDVVADLYTPPGVDAAHPAPAILATNGFGGSKDDQAGLAQQFGRAGYVFLSYSGLGFGGSGCKIELDDRDYDGKAGSQLIDFLGGKSGNAFADAAHTIPVAAPNYVVRDDLAGRPASDGTLHANDPRVGMIGGSYGGQIQFAVAGIDPRLDTIIPQITWNDLSYSLAPNNDASQTGVTYPATNPGMEKVDWVSLFFGLGIVDGVSGIQADPTRMVGCPNFDFRACTGKAQMDALGYPLADTIATERHASVGSYLGDIKIPTLLSQGQADTLFNLQEAVATYRGLSQRNVPVHMIWQSWGHSGSTPAPGEYSTAADVNPTAFYDNARYLNWFNHYLKDDATADTGPAFAWFRDDVTEHAHGLTDPRYSSASSYPAYGSQSYFLSAPVQTNGTPVAPCSAGDLITSASATSPGNVTLLAPPEVPVSYTETSAVDQTLPVTDAPCAAATFDGPAVALDSPIVGTPKVTLHLDAPTYAASQVAGPSGDLVLFAKLLDVAPDGTVTLPHRLISPIRVADVTKPVTIELPGIVHTLPAGHHLELRIASSDAAYRGNTRPGLVNVVLDPAAPSELTVPMGPPETPRVVPSPTATATATATATPTATPSGTTTASPSATASSTPSATASSSPSAVPTTASPTATAPTVTPTTAAPTAVPTSAAPTSAAPTSAAPTSTGAAGNGGTQAAPSCTGAPSLTVLDPEIRPGQIARVRLTATPGDQVRIEAISAPATDYRTVRPATSVPANGRVDYGFVPVTNTRLRAVGAQCGTSPSTVVGVHPTLSLTAHRTSAGHFTFSGTLRPAQQDNGMTVTLFYRTGSGAEVRKGYGTSHHGRFTIPVNFLRDGTLRVFVRTATSAINLSGQSPDLSVQVH